MSEADVVSTQQARLNTCRTFVHPWPATSVTTLCKAENPKRVIAVSRFFRARMIWLGRFAFTTAHLMMCLRVQVPSLLELEIST